MSEFDLPEEEKAELRKCRCTGIIKTFHDIEETGDLPPGFHWRTIKWDERRGWIGYISGPNGATNWLKVKKLPKEALDMVTPTW